MGVKVFLKEGYDFYENHYYEKETICIYSVVHFYFCTFLLRGNKKLKLDKLVEEYLINDRGIVFKKLSRLTGYDVFIKGG